MRRGRILIDLRFRKGPFLEHLLNINSKAHMLTVSLAVSYPPYVSRLVRIVALALGTACISEGP